LKEELDDCGATFLAFQRAHAHGGAHAQQAAHRWWLEDAALRIDQATCSRTTGASGFGTSTDEIFSQQPFSL